MRREIVTLWAGVLLAAGSLAILLVNEGVFFDTEPPETAIMVQGRDCAGDILEIVRPVTVSIEGATFFGGAADLVYRVGVDPFVAQGCQGVRLVPFMAAELTDRTSKYDVDDSIEEWDDKVTHLTRTDQPDAFVERFADVELRFPGLFKRVSADAFVARLGLPEDSRFATVQAYGKVGYWSEGDDGVDFTFRFDAFERISSVIAIVFATLLGIGVGAVFEATLIMSTMRRLEDLKRQLRDADHDQDSP